mmetsp:Transcript_28041/g.63511  ORF Transcript_28041/g.63511 Transcript_28041/m.63511 type:complete len:193 (-) Transcript_28041:233-811(-)
MRSRFAAHPLAAVLLLGVSQPAGAQFWKALAKIDTKKIGDSLRSAGAEKMVKDLTGGDAVKSLEKIGRGADLEKVAGALKEASPKVQDALAHTDPVKFEKVLHDADLTTKVSTAIRTVDEVVWWTNHWQQAALLAGGAVLVLLCVCQLISRLIMRRQRSPALLMGADINMYVHQGMPYMTPDSVGKEHLAHP